MGHVLNNFRPGVLRQYVFRKKRELTVMQHHKMITRRTEDWVQTAEQQEESF